ncbi:hypothetical protein [Paraburkholderia caledonica]|uniref:hypothetical protein n=1 Tax=Paraburkholderia caledonica TaxID=134536 RepID=UPI003CB0274C
MPCIATALGNVCEHGYLVEDFGLPVNLMLACAAQIVEGGPLACLHAIADARSKGMPPRPVGRLANGRFGRVWGDANSVYKVLEIMTDSHLWTAEPHIAYLQWQTTEAAGADRRRFSQRSIVQHKAMFERFLRHLVIRGVALATFEPEHLESFFGDVENRCAPLRPNFAPPDGAISLSTAYDRRYGFPNLAHALNVQSPCPRSQRRR